MSYNQSMSMSMSYNQSMSMSYHHNIIIRSCKVNNCLRLKSSSSSVQYYQQNTITIRIVNTTIKTRKYID